MAIGPARLFLSQLRQDVLAVEQIDEVLATLDSATDTVRQLTDQRDALVAEIATLQARRSAAEGEAAQARAHADETVVAVNQQIRQAEARQAARLGELDGELRERAQQCASLRDAQAQLTADLEARRRAETAALTEALAQAKAEGEAALRGEMALKRQAAVADLQALAKKLAAG